MATDGWIRRMNGSVLAAIRLAAIALMCAVGLGESLLQSADPTRVFIFAGQSNMVGADAKAEEIPEFPHFRDTVIPREDILFSYRLGNGDEVSKGWVPLRPLKAFGPEVTFADEVSKHVSFPIAIIKSAVGGTTIAFDWNPDAPVRGQQLYPKTLQLIRDSLRELTDRGIAYKLEGVMWHQGENDMLDRMLYPKYAVGLNQLIARLRSDLSAPDLEWYLGEVSEKGIWGMDHRANLGAFRTQQQHVLDGDARTHFVPTSHLAFEVMGSGQPHYHFGTQGQLQMGQAFAKAYLQRIGALKTSPDRSYQGKLPIAANGRVRIFVLAGQRNMEGEDAHVAELAQLSDRKALAQPQTDVLFRYSLGGGVTVSSDWEPLGPVDELGNFGPELSFGAQLRARLPKEEGIAIVKFTHSGAQGPDWAPQGNEPSHRQLYQKLLAFLRAAENDLKERGYAAKVEGVFWHAGENDTYFGPYAQNNAKWTQQWIDRLRSDLGDPSIACFITEQHKNSPWVNIDIVNTGLREMASEVPRVTTVSTEKLSHGRKHFGTLGTVELGDAMAEAYLRQK